jgi:DNA processing protein
MNDPSDSQVPVRPSGVSGLVTTDRLLRPVRAYRVERSGAHSPLLRDERFARAAWTFVAEPGDARAVALVARLGAVEALQAVAQSRQDGVRSYRDRAERLDIGALLRAAEHRNARVLVPEDVDWPSGVQDLSAPPICLWVRGDHPLAALRDASVAIVGSRACTRYGEDVALGLASGLADRGFAVVSGAAFGIDRAAHLGALAVERPTIAVLACGVDRDYPAAHAGLLREIAATGALVSEVAPGGAPMRSRFLVRNRLIATMSTGTVVVEAGLRSGSLNTARQAADHGRPVGAVPGPVTSMSSAGCHQAVRDGYALVVTDVAEVMDLVGAMGVDAARRPAGPTRPEDSLGATDRAVFAALPVRAPVEAGDLARHAGVTAVEAAAGLGRLELIGLARRRDGGWMKTAGRASGSARGIPAAAVECDTVVR